MSAPIIEFRGVNFAYDSAMVLHCVDLTLHRGEFACLVGPNGGGKTTLLKLMLGLLAPTAGEVRVLGLPPHEARRRIGYMPQHVQLDPSFPITALDVVLMGRLGGMLGYYSKRDRQLAREALDEVGLADIGGRGFSALSGGQRQRVLIARALACEPEILMLDEPTSNVDVGVEEQIYALLTNLNRRLSIVVVSHDVGFVSKYPQTAVCVDRHVHTHTREQLTGEVIRNLYGREIRLLSHEVPLVSLGRPARP
jgi:zinc transport system ATP-binding protein